MAANRGRTRRRDNAPTVLLQGRVAPGIKDEFRAAASASGLSDAYYLEELLQLISEEKGGLPIITAFSPKEPLNFDFQEATTSAA